MFFILELKEFLCNKMYDYRGISGSHREIFMGLYQINIFTSKDNCIPHGSFITIIHPKFDTSNLHYILTLLPIFEIANQASSIIIRTSSIIEF